MSSLDQNIKRADPEGFEVLGRQLERRLIMQNFYPRRWRKLSLY